MDSRDLIVKGLRWIIGNGQAVAFWTFNWVFPFPLNNLIDQASLNQIDLDSKVADFILMVVGTKINYLSGLMTQPLIKYVKLLFLVIISRTPLFGARPVMGIFL